jgi:hypothetical protein
MAEVKSVLPQANPHNVTGEPNATGYQPVMTADERH